MKATINGKRYDVRRCEELASHDHRTHSNNYSGTTSLMRAADGTFLLWTDSNGQDCWLQDSFVRCDDVQEFLNGADMNDKQETRLIELGLIELV